MVTYMGGCIEDLTCYEVLCWYCTQILTSSGDFLRDLCCKFLGEGCWKGVRNKLNGTMKLLKDKPIKIQTLLVQQVFLQMTIKMSENCTL